jgi:hypothetical protein
MQLSRETKRACALAVVLPMGLGLYHRQAQQSMSTSVKVQTEPPRTVWNELEKSIHKKFPKLQERLAMRGKPTITPCNDDEHVMANNVGGSTMDDYFGPLRGSGVLTEAEQKTLQKLRKIFPMQRQDGELLRHGLLRSREDGQEHIRVIASNHTNNNEAAASEGVRRAGADVPVGLHLPTGQLPITPGSNKEDKEWQRCRAELENRLWIAAKANPLLPRYTRNGHHLSQPHNGDVTAIDDFQDFYVELAEDATRISRLYLGLDKMHGVNLIWEEHAAAHPSRLTGESVRLWSAPSPTVLPGDLPAKVVRAQGVIKASKELITDLMLDDSRSHEYDKFVADYAILRRDVEARQFVRHYRYRSVWPTAPRDLAALSTYTECDDGSLLISTISLPEDGRFMPQVPGHVRAQVISSCCLIKPLGNGDRCDVTFVSHVNPGGNIPVSISNILGPTNSQDTLKNCRDILERQTLKLTNDA